MLAKVGGPWGGVSLHIISIRTGQVRIGKDMVRSCQAESGQVRTDKVMG